MKQYLPQNGVVNDIILSDDDLCARRNYLEN